jgi:hypothetical protein
LTPAFGIWDPGSGSGIQDRDPGQVKSQDSDPGSGSGMENPDHILRAEKPFFLVKILKFFDADPGSNIQDGKKFRSGIRDPGWKKFGSRIWDPGWKKFGSGIQDPG